MMNERNNAPMIRLENVSFCYDPRRPLLRGVSLDVASDARICLFGPSGSGKTTLARLLLGLEKPDRGSVTRRPGLRYSAVFQEDRLLPHKTVLENVKLFAEAASMPADAENPAGPEALAGSGFTAGPNLTANAEALLSRLGLGEALSQYPSELSGGMKRRTALVRALCHPFGLLLLDEPFNGLDEEARSVCADAILDHAKEKAVVLITHRAEDAELLGIRETVRLPFC